MRSPIEVLRLKIAFGKAMPRRFIGEGTEKPSEIYSIHAIKNTDKEITYK